MGVLELVRKLPYDHPYRWDGRTFGKPKLWTPSEISLAAWFDAADLSTIVQSGGAVSQWNDKSGNARHLVQPTGASQLSTGIRTLNGLNVLDGNGTQWIELTPFPLNADGNVSVFGVFVSDLVLNQSDSVFAMDNVGSGADFKLCASTVGYNGPDFRGFIQGSTGGGTQLPLFTGYPHNGPSIFNAEFNKTAGTRTGRIDGIDRTSGAYTVNIDPSTKFTVLADKGAMYKLNGAVGEVVVVHDDLTLATRQKIEGYLAWKWSLEANLPVGHPYKSTPPVV